MSRATLAVSTRNPHKLIELRALLETIAPLHIVTAEDAGVPEVEETGATFLDNAVLKAAAAFRVTGGLCLADDSGLVVDALGGAPGVHSARFSGPGANAERNNEHLLAALAGVADAQRAAAFVCHLALVVPAERGLSTESWAPTSHPGVPRGAALYAFEGRVAGRIQTSYRGAGGVGYDPLFLYEPAGLTFAEMGREAKNAVSHRGRALAQLARCLEALTSAGS